ncbi:MAG: protein kinase [Phycisphaerales bacterium]|nr:protein kinase [Phycisphaerales bacterium]
MNQQQLERVDEVFEQALERTSEERTAFIAKACATEPEVRTEVESLLEHHEKASPDFMKPNLLPAPLNQGMDDPLIGQKIGNYLVKSVIASGGMGRVYLAEQEEPQREVALKILQPGLVGRSALRRFRYESEILAKLQHPNIAHVFEAGMANVGRQPDGNIKYAVMDPDRSEQGLLGKRAQTRVPFFAMEYIPDAQPITLYAEQVNLTIRQRLELFATVCDAVYHGHQKGVIHRDLKPTNILVDGTGQVKIIDLGVARSTNSDIAVTTLQTDVGQLVGTLQYMSPEQCSGDSHELDVRSDVYSLGLVLYELLCGQLPYDVSRTPIPNAVRIICEESSARPSCINQSLRGDLEIIVLKALEKDRWQRYQSTSALADDVQHYLSGEPISARRPTAIYQLRMLVKKHRTASLAACIVFMALMAATSISTVFAIRAEREAQAATESELTAELMAYTANMANSEAALKDYDPATAVHFLETARQNWQKIAQGESLPWEWYHVSGRLDQSVSNLIETPGKILRLAADQSGRFLAIKLNSEPNQVVVYHIDEQESTHSQILECRDGLTSIAFNNDGSLLAVACMIDVSHECFIKIWKRAAPFTFRPAAEWKVNGLHVTAMAFHPNSSMLAGAYDNSIHFWDLIFDHRTKFTEVPDEYQPRASLVGHSRNVLDLAFTSDGSVLASASLDSTVRLWNIRSTIANVGSEFDESVVLMGHTDHVNAVQFDPNDELLATASTDKTVRIWSLSNCHPGKTETTKDGQAVAPQEAMLAVLTDHTEGVMDLAFDSTGSRLVSAGGDRTIRVWDIRPAASISESHKQISVARPCFRLVNTLRGHKSWVSHLAYLPDHRVMSASTGEGIVKLWEVDCPDLPKLQQHQTSVVATAFTPDDRYIVSTSGGGDDSVMISDVQSCVRTDRIFYRYNEGITDVTCFRLADRSLFATTSGHPQMPVRHGRVSLRELNAKGETKLLWQFPSRSEASDLVFVSLAVSPDGEKLAAADSTGRIHVWNIICDTLRFEVQNTGELDTRNPGHNCVLFLDSEGRWLTAARGPSTTQSGTSTVQIWNTETETCVVSYSDYNQPVEEIAISPDRKRLAAACSNGTIQMWTVMWKQGIPELRHERELRGHSTQVNTVVFHPTGSRLLSGSSDRTIKIWTKEGKEAFTLRGLSGPVTDLAFDSSGKRLAAASGGFHGDDNVVWLWETAPSADEKARLGKVRSLAMRAKAEVWQVFANEPVESIAAAKAKLIYDQRLPEDVRAFVEDRFEDLLPHPLWFYMYAESAIQSSDKPVKSYYQALNWIQAAVEMAPQNELFRRASAILQHRIGKHELALAELKKSKSLGHDVNPADWALLSLIHHAQGRASESKQALSKMNKLAKDRCVDISEKRIMDEAITKLRD